jgi:hypothetical protein
LVAWTGWLYVPEMSLSQLEIESELADYFGDEPWFSTDDAEYREQSGDCSSTGSSPAPNRPGGLSLSASLKAPRFHSFSPWHQLRLRIEQLEQRRHHIREDHEDDAAALPRKQYKLALARRAFEERRRELAARPVDRRDYVAALDRYFVRHEAYCERAVQITRMAEVQSQLAQLLQSQAQLRHHSSLPDLVPLPLRDGGGPALSAPILRAMLTRLDCLRLLMASQSGELLIKTFESQGLYVFIALDGQSHALRAYVVIRTRLLLLK